MRAIEWLVNELLHLDNEYDMNFIDKNMYQQMRKELINEAKEIESEQRKQDIINTYLHCSEYDQASIFMKQQIKEDAEDYSNEIIKSE
jgi:RNA polymerase-interacting CarD/CdnL/TRCF family regulator